MLVSLDDDLSDAADQYPLTQELRGRIVQIVTDLYDDWQADFNRAEAERLRLQTELDNANRDRDRERARGVVDPTDEPDDSRGDVGTEQGASRGL
jgi:hypothetical protein